MEVTERIDLVLSLPVKWDHEARKGHRPQILLDYLQERHKNARFRKAHTSDKKNRELKALKKGQKRAFLFVTNTEKGAILINGERIPAIKGTLIELDHQAVTIEYTNSPHQLILEYAL